MMLTKSVPIKMKDIDETGGVGTFAGYASTFGNEDLVGDVFDRGAFKRTAKAKGKGLPILLSHSHTEQIGLNLEMEEDDKGLLVKGELLVADIPKAKEVYAIVRRAAELGRNMGLSVGFRVIKEKWEEEVRHFKEVELFEYSFTPFPANPLAGTVAMRDGEAASSTALELYRLSKRIKDAGYEDDPAQRRHIIAAIKELQALVGEDDSSDDTRNSDDTPPGGDSDDKYHSLLEELRSFRGSISNVGV